MSVLPMNSPGAGGLVFANNFIKVIQDIMSSTANLKLTPENASEEIERSYPSFITGMMILHGERDIVLTLTFSKLAAAEVVVSMLNIKYTQIIENEVYDAIMEITNMIAGRLKTATMASGNHYQLTTPFVFVGSNHFIGAHTRPANLVKKFKDNQFEMMASVFFL